MLRYSRDKAEIKLRNKLRLSCDKAETKRLAVAMAVARDHNRPQTHRPTSPPFQPETAGARIPHAGAQRAGIARCVCIAGVRRRRAEGAGTTARRGPECDEEKR